MLDNHIDLRHSFYDFKQDFTDLQKPDQAKRLKNKIAEKSSNVRYWMDDFATNKHLAANCGEKNDEMCFWKGRVYIQHLLNVLWLSICTPPAPRDVGASLSSH